MTPMVAMPEDVDLLKLVCHRLETANIAYMLTGSLAANFYAVPRMTRDIDIVIEICGADVNKIVQLFRPDFYIEREGVVEALRFQQMFNIIHNSTVFKVDFIIRKNSDYRYTEFNRRRRIQLDDTSIWIVAPEDLIISKLHWASESGSETQINDVRNLFVAMKDLDKEYLSKWIHRLELHAIYEKVGIDA